MIISKTNLMLFSISGLILAFRLHWHLLELAAVVLDLQEFASSGFQEEITLENGGILFALLFALFFSSIQKINLSLQYSASASIPPWISSATWARSFCLLGSLLWWLLWTLNVLSFKSLVFIFLSCLCVHVHVWACILGYIWGDTCAYWRSGVNLRLSFVRSYPSYF